MELTIHSVGGDTIARRYHSARTNKNAGRNRNRFFYYAIFLILFQLIQIIKAAPYGEVSHKYIVYADDLTILPTYENSVNPFLSHIEQARNLKPKKSHNHVLQKKLHKKKTKHDALLDDLQLDPERPHFIESNEYVDATEEDYKPFGDEEKDLRQFFQVLFSSDY